MRKLIDRNVVPSDLVAVNSELQWLDPRPVFFGGSVISLYVNDPAVAAEAVRRTEDIDVLICIPGGQTTAQAEQALRAHGWRDDIRTHRKNAQAFVSPGGIPVDVVFDRLQPDSDWIVRAAHSPEVIQLGDQVVHVPSPAYLVASKLAAAENPSRWESAYSSHDLADVLTFGCTMALESLRAAPEDVPSWPRQRTDDRHAPSSNRGGAILRRAERDGRAERPRAIAGPSFDPFPPRGDAQGDGDGDGEVHGDGQVHVDVRGREKIGHEEVRERNGDRTSLR